MGKDRPTADDLELDDLEGATLAYARIDHAKLARGHAAVATVCVDPDRFHARRGRVLAPPVRILILKS